MANSDARFSKEKDIVLSLRPGILTGEFTAICGPAAFFAAISHPRQPAAFFAAIKGWAIPGGHGLCGTHSFLPFGYAPRTVKKAHARRRERK